jgi:hypothetical protein
MNNIRRTMKIVTYSETNENEFDREGAGFVPCVASQWLTVNRISKSRASVTETMKVRVGYLSDISR